jgi:hypothetical protein
VSDPINEMIASVAKAIEAAHDDYKPTVHDYLGMATAAISAMRDPSDAMKEAAYNAVSMDDQWHIEDEGRWAKSWQGAIDEALK